MHLALDSLPFRQRDLPRSSALRDSPPGFFLLGSRVPPQTFIRRGSPVLGERLCLKTRPCPQSPGAGQRDPHRLRSRVDTTRLLRGIQETPSFCDAPRLPSTSGERILSVPPPRREMRRLPGLRLGPASPPLQARGPPRSASSPPAGAASGELSPGAGGTRRWGRGGVGADPGGGPTRDGAGRGRRGQWGGGLTAPGGVPPAPLPPPAPLRPARL